ncbi:endonuclease/exonuclease/phosphatase family protein [Pseudoroseomonas globiformis]|uniref:Endonuclease/exonuclease/phosphatase family protein n=1 Tax=Teichococcus globiformis TaxID=2307229 RepID=A0ABV7G9E1_9PROT
MKVATWNIHRGWGMDGRYDPGRIISVIAEIGPDIMALQEAQHYVRRAVPMLDPHRLAQESDLVPVVVRQEPDHQGWRSNVLLIRKGLKLRGCAEGLRLGGWEPRGAISAWLETGCSTLQVICAHLSLGRSRRIWQAERLLEAAGGDGTPTLLLGDFNERHSNGKMMSMLSTRFSRPSKVATFPAPWPVWSLDRILADPASMLHDVAVHNTRQARRASDHLPLTASLSI